MMLFTVAVISSVVLAGAYLFSRSNEVDVGEELERMRDKFTVLDGSASSSASERELDDVLTDLASSEEQSTGSSVFSDEYGDSGTNYGEFDPLSESVYHEDYSST